MGVGLRVFSQGGYQQLVPMPLLCAITAVGLLFLCLCGILKHLLCCIFFKNNFLAEKCDCDVDFFFSFKCRRYFEAGG